MSLSKVRNSEKTRPDKKQDRSSKQIKTEELRGAFAFFDRNRNGCIEAEELGTVMESLGYKASNEELRDMINEADLDGNNTIDFDEFVRLMENKGNFEGRNEEEEELKEAFKVFDCDGNGFISREELSKVMKNIGEDLTEQDLTDMICEADKNGDGVIDFQEFSTVLAKK